MHTPILTDDMKRIIDVANELIATGGTSGSTSERIAAAFILNDTHYLPASYTDILEAWDRQGHWQTLVRQIKADYRHRVLNPSL